MSDSTKKQEKFNSKKFLQELCAGTKVEINTHDIRFRKGWAELVKSFISEVGNSRIDIYAITDEHNFLEIDVDLSETSKAKAIYMAIQSAKYHSIRTCPHCGVTKSKGQLFCETCRADAAKIGATGTWLDDFRG